MSFLEYVYYESLPYVYAALAVFAYSQHEVSKWAGAATIILAYCSYFVLQQRFRHRTVYKKFRNQTRI